MDLAVQTYGRLGVTVNNAGLVKRSSVTDVKVDDWERMIDPNLRCGRCCTASRRRCPSCSSENTARWSRSRQEPFRKQVDAASEPYTLVSCTARFGLE